MTDPNLENPAQDEERQEIDWKKMSRKHEDRAKALSSEVEELKKQLAELTEEATSKSQAEKSLSEQLADFQSQIDKLREENSSKDRALLVERVANTKKVPAKYLSGETEDELNASADEYLRDLEAMLASREEEKRPGYVPSQGTGDPSAGPSSFESGAARARAKYQKN